MTEFPETQSLLLANIQSLENREAWEEFVVLYRPVIYRMARRRGMQDSDAQDLTQDVLVRIAGAIGRWEPRPGVRFRHWIRKVAGNAILSRLSNSSRNNAIDGDVAEQMIAEFPDQEATSQELENECLRERYLRAAATVKNDVSPETWQAFQQTVIEGQPCEAAAESLSKSIGTIYAARSRVLKRLREEVTRFEGDQS